MNQTIHYQKTEHDCWICTIKNMLSFIDIQVSEEEIQRILLDEKNLSLFSGRGFFTYVPVVLDALRIPCEFVLDTEDDLLQQVLSGTSCAPFNPERLDSLLQEYQSTGNSLYYFYHSLQLIALSPHISLKFNVPTVRDYLDQEYVVAACLPVSALYGIRDNNTLHTVTLVKEKNSLKIIDPYESIGRKNEANWSLYCQHASRINWSEKIPYFAALRQTTGRQIPKDNRSTG